MLQAKYKAHKFINLFFYLVIFVIGFLLGYSGKQLNFSNLLDKFLLIDKVQAYGYPTYTHTYESSLIDFHVTSSNYNTSATAYNIFEIFKLVDGFTPVIDDVYKYVQVLGIFSKPEMELTSVLYSYSPANPVCANNYMCGSQNSIKIVYSLVTNTWAVSYYGGTRFEDFYGTDTSTNAYRYFYSYGNNSTLNLFPYVYQGTYNFNLFSDNFSNFKEVCVNPESPFVVSSTAYYPGSLQSSDFFWYGGQISSLQHAYLFTESNTLSTFETFTNNDVFLRNASVISRFFSNLYTVDLQASIISTYPNLTTNYTRIPFLSYFGWSVYPIILDYGTANPVFPVYRLTENYTLTQFSNGGTLHGGSTRTHHNIEDENSSQVCFWVNNMYEITELQVDEFGYYYGSIPTPSGNIDFYSNGNNYDFFGHFNNNTYGLSTIVTAPLNSIRAITNGTCTPISVPVLNTSFNLPCGDTLFWNKESVQDFKVFWNIFVGGIILYRLGISLFYDIKRFRDPEDDKVEVIDL